jgi:hypothetical protein
MEMQPELHMPCTKTARNLLSLVSQFLFVTFQRRTTMLVLGCNPITKKTWYRLENLRIFQSYGKV